jgi:anaerobic magnesium-protoporphyrin IX monomethyl ester cyclase
MNIGFIFPPLAAPFMPPLGLPLLSAFLEVHGVRSTLHDLNIAFYNHLLEPQSVTSAFERIRFRMRKYKDRDQLTADEAANYIELLPIVMSAEYVERHLVDSLSLYRRRRAPRDRFDLFRCSQALAYSLRAVAHDLGHLNANPRNPYLLIGPDAWQQIETWPEWQSVLEWYFGELKVCLGQTEVIGLSVCYPTQLPFALLTASKIRRLAPNVKIVWGGAFVTSMAKHVTHNVPKGFLATQIDLIDAVIVEDGEFPLLDYLQSLEMGRPIRHPSVLTRSGLDTPPAKSQRGPVPPLVKPSFHKLPLDQYLTPQLTLPMITSRHCYWGKCTFCAHSISYGRYQQYRGSEIVRQICELEAEHGPLSVYFMDECVPPKNAFLIAEGLARAGSQVRWAADMRFEKQLSREKLSLLRAGGCRYIAFGLETINDRVGKLMQKGTHPKVVSRIITDCYEEGIHTCLMFFCGFPTETNEEATETVNFVLAHIDQVSAVGMSQFTLCPGTKLYEYAEEFGIHHIQSSGEFETLNGMSRTESRAFRAEAGAIFAQRIYEGHELYHRLFYTMTIADPIESHATDPWPLAVTNRNELSARWRAYFGAQPSKKNVKVWKDIGVESIPFDIECYCVGKSLFRRKDRKSGMVLLNFDHPESKLVFLKPNAWRAFSSSAAFGELLSEPAIRNHLFDNGIICYE